MLIIQIRLLCVIGRTVPVLLIMQRFTLRITEFVIFLLDPQVFVTRPRLIPE